MRALIALIGPRGSGKTTLGRRLAQQLGWRFVDTDELVEARLGTSIAALFATGREPEFRAAEEAAVADALRGDRVVVATGGGAVLRPATRERLKAVFTAWLWAPPERLAQNVLGSDRPPLTSLAPLDELATVLAARRPLYADCAAFSLDTSSLALEPACQALEQAWRSAGRAVDGEGSAAPQERS